MIRVLLLALLVLIVFFLPQRINPLLFPTPTPQAAQVPTPEGQVQAPATKDTATIPTTRPTTWRPTGRLSALHHSGQTFLTWPERDDLQDEVYRVYRANEPISQNNVAQATRLAQVGENSSRMWSNYSGFYGEWSPRLIDRMIIEDGGAPLAENTGALVWTLGPEDFNGGTSGTGYYAVTVLEDGQDTEYLLPEYITGPVEESVADPTPVEISHSPGIQPGPGGHYYLQFMDLRHWNPTFHAPNSTNEFLGYDPQKDKSLANALGYTYDYAIFEPTPDLCGGQIPDPLPVMIFLHGAKGNRYGNPDNYPYPYCAYGVYPIDESDTWYFGFARNHDYRINDVVEAGDVIENFTEQRILRMVYDLMRNPPGPVVDTQRVYLFGHSMGGTGALAFAERYPNVFAAIYVGQPVTYFRATQGVKENWPNLTAVRWGAQELNLPVAISAPNRWADHLQKYNGTGVFDWENLQAAFDPNTPTVMAGDDMVPFGIDHGTIDDSVKFPTQGQTLYPMLNSSRRTWAGAVSENEHHWSVFGWPLANLSKVNEVPFYNFGVIRDETVPGFRFLSGNETGLPEAPTTYNQTILWSASWNAWDGAPVDNPDVWQMSFCAVKPGDQTCGSGEPLSVDITPRRLQRFQVTPGKEYAWENVQVSSGRVIASGTVEASEDGLVSVPGVQISPGGNRLRIRVP